MFKAHNISLMDMELPEALKRLRKKMKKSRKLGFTDIWKKVNIGQLVQRRWQEVHWALSPELAHYVHDQPNMHWGFGEDMPQEVKAEPYDADEVW